MLVMRFAGSIVCTYSIERGEGIHWSLVEWKLEAAKKNQISKIGI